ncbi:hypothetical protein BOW49_11170 [Solemya velum gill symbiont]|uniref:3-hydroxyacyl-CoA dehydrogenase NAD-binding domain-containing protein n=1 Tax=Solemya velum gill symbiont TaxID=2340 RepID=UPI000997BE94|nr:3-hydroxyacyl-CoA dehydrogenase NAD-binding domain-containing protein [Solemya velum gill symbiont]OOZ72323.1 hypothetical protein BOW49_11170 [Solemya velum gill symbiont]
MKHWHLTHEASGICWLTFDQLDSKVNTLSAETMDEFSHCLDMLESDTPKLLIIHSGKRAGFMAGANIRQFAGMNEIAEAEAVITNAHQLLFRLEQLSCISVAAIDGHCLGGGLELALACDYRIATDELHTRLGFPEVRLGIFPGFGGSVRSIERIGHLAAMQLMLSGRTLSATAAKRIGLVDDAVPLRQLESAALYVQKQLPTRNRVRLIEKLAGLPLVRNLVAIRMRKAATEHANEAHYPAPYALIEHWRQHACNKAAMYRSEVTRVSRLLCGKTAQSLVRVFLLQETLRAKAAMDVEKHEHLHVIGAGIMGGDIAAWAVLHGMQVSLQDTSKQQLARALKRANKLFEKRLKNPRLVTQAMDRLIPDPAGNGVNKADLVIEAIIEDVDAKQALFASVVPRMKADAILATNTSSIPLESLGESLPDPQRLVGLHFFNPVAKMPLLEIIHTGKTDSSVINKAMAFALQLKKLPLRVTSCSGFLVNRVLMPYLLEAVMMIDEGEDPAAIDQAAKAFGMPMGPVELADTVGLDIALSVARKMSQFQHCEVPGSLAEKVGNGELGRKSGSGYYSWKNGKITNRKNSEFTPELQQRLILNLLNEAVSCRHDGIVGSDDELDAGIIFGAGFAPFTGGPINYIHTHGAREIVDQLKSLEKKHGKRFSPGPGWKQLEGG